MNNNDDEKTVEKVIELTNLNDDGNDEMIHGVDIIDKIIEYQTSHKL